ncbi:MAG: hypothetical protein MR343_02715 [Clostridia bacterium]|nr:hypothetical protein [Clostridia bacterium]MDD7701376.1 hypothetical protein [Eubacteriales bacterium]MDY2827327.1 hypothetical protein [Eubacteriales bacterium]
MSRTKGKKKGRKMLLASLIDQIRQDKKAFAVYVILHTITIFSIIRSLVTRQYETFFSSVLALLLLLIPSIVEKSFHIRLPTTMEIIVYAFVFCAQILGEGADYYQRFAFWDVMLHSCNGFLFSAFGFCLVDIFNKSKRLRFKLSPLFLSLVAFCFSMTIGVLWEFFEFSADYFLHTDMQKDVFKTVIDTVSIPNDLGEKVTHIRDITGTVIYTTDGQIITMNGYLDVGITDTMKDLFMNFLGAVLFSIIGFFYVKHRGRGTIASQFIPVVLDAEGENDESEDGADTTDENAGVPASAPSVSDRKDDEASGISENENTPKTGSDSGK